MIKGNQSIIVDTTADDESGSRKEAPNGDFDMIPKCMQRNPPPDTERDRESFGKRTARLKKKKKKKKKEQARSTSAKQLHT